MNDSVDENAKINEGGSSAVSSVSGAKIVVFAIIAVIVLVVLFRVLAGAYSSFFASDDTPQSKADQVKVVDGPTATEVMSDPTVPVDLGQLEAIKDTYAQSVEDSAGHRQTSVLPGISGEEVADDEMINDLEAALRDLNNEPVEDVAPEPELREEAPSSDGENPYAPQISELFAQWDTPNQAGQGKNLYIPESIYAASDAPTVNEVSDGATESRRILNERNVDYLQVYPATLELGYNSDTGGLMIVTVHHQGLKGIKFQADTSIGAYNERAAITLKTGVLEDGTAFNVEAVVVDQKDRIPSVKGKVNRHLIYNTVYGLGTSLLDAFAQYSELDAGLVRGVSLFPSIPTNTNEQAVDTDGLVVANGAKALSSSIKQLGEFRPNTLTTKPWKTVGVVFLPEQ